MTRTIVEEFDDKGRLGRRTITERDEVPLTLPYTVTPYQPWPQYPAYPPPTITCGNSGSA